MHEFSIVQSLLEGADCEARRAGATRITRLLCRIGSLRMVDDWLLQEAFKIARVNTMCRDADLVVEKTFMQASCPRCGVRFPVRDWDWSCPTCSTQGVDPAGGDELELISLEAEVPDADRSAQERLPAE